MDTNSPQTWAIVLIVVIALVVAAYLIARQRQSRRLQQRFGPEYGRLVAKHGDRAKAESELAAREKRVERLQIVRLSPADAARFSQAWDELQTRFVDNPKGVVRQADALVRDLMVRRGYPMADFERRAADISVDHPALVETYRSAQAIAERERQGNANTEELRKAVVHYRALFDELLEVRSARKVTESNTVVQS